MENQTKLTLTLPKGTLKPDSEGVKKCVYLIVNNKDEKLQLINKDDKLHLVAKEDKLLSIHSKDDKLQYFKWSSEKTKPLIELYKKYINEVGTPKMRTNKEMWKTIAQELEKILHIDITPEVCENKWKGLERSYRKHCENQIKGEDMRPFEFADDLHEINESRRSANPKISLASDSVTDNEDSKAADVLEKYLLPSDNKRKRKISFLRHTNEDSNPSPRYKDLKLKREDEKINELKRRNNLISHRNSLLQKKNEIANEKNDNLRKKIEVLNNQNDILRNQNEILKNQNEILKHQNDLLKDRNDILKDKNCCCSVHTKN